jgi:hypothetical protein
MKDLSLNQLSVITHVDQIDLRSLFDFSVDSMSAGSFSFPAELQTNDEKFEYFKNIVITMFSDDQCFAYKRCIDGADVVFHIGKTRETKFVYILGLVAEIDGSKSWIYKDEAYEQQMQFLINNNFTGIILNTIKDSTAEKHVIERYTRIQGVKCSVLGPVRQTRNTLIEFPS